MAESDEEWWKEEFLANIEKCKQMAVLLVVIENSMKFISAFIMDKSFIFSYTSILMTIVTFLIACHLNKTNIKCNNFNVLCAIVFTELFNSALFIVGNKFDKDSKSILFMESTLITVLFESSFINSLFFVNLALIKNIMLWYGASMLFGSDGISSLIQIIAFISCLTIHTTKEYQVRRTTFERYSYRKKLEKSEKRLGTILNVIPDGLAIFSSQLVPELINEKMKDYLNCDNENFIEKLIGLRYVKNKKFQNINPDSDSLIEDLKLYNNLNLSGELILGIVKESDLSLQWKIKRITVEDEEIILVTASNSGQLIELEQRETEDKVKKFMLRTISHELRTPISAIISFANQIYEQTDDSSQVRKNVQHIRTSARILMYFINDILDYMQLMKGMFSLRQQEFNIRDKIIECCDLFELTALRKGIELKTRIDPQIPEIIYNDPERICQVLINFLSNATKFTNKGRIEVCVTLSEDDRLKFSISDTGIGIPEERFNQIFKLFNSYDTDEMASHGSGLGLHLSSLLVRELGGGDIYLHSVQGRGTVFSFKVNFAAETRQSFSAIDCSEEILEPVMRLKSFISCESCEYPQVLIVDDTDWNREILAAVLDKLKIHYLEAVNGKKALKLVMKQDAKMNPFKLVFMDCSMPVMDGWESTKRIKQLHEEGKLSLIPAIVGYTAYTSEKDVIMCYESGMVSYIAKPASIDTIRRVLSQYLRL
ncbi:unnamed protein product [Blepharisma stoltei]|uniref:Histidine kinase n=1 Tax=Blepharisma stoltei TaxID=1481888 RepID=A0AAU9IFA3_9CILI|nr:unnamed protein product [Blepharisma stoltei]